MPFVEFLVTEVDLTTIAAALNGVALSSRLGYHGVDEFATLKLTSAFLPGTYPEFV